MNTAINYEHFEHKVTNNTKKTHTLITEVFIPNASNSNQIILPLVASLTKEQKEQQRWVTWITDRKPQQKDIKLFSPNLAQLRIIHIKNSDDNRWIIWDALNKGNSHSVIADMASLNAEELREMEAAAKNGKCSGIFIRTA